MSQKRAVFFVIRDRSIAELIHILLEPNKELAALISPKRGLQEVLEVRPRSFFDRRSSG